MPVPESGSRPVLLDIGGCLLTGLDGEPIPGAAAAVRRLRTRGPLRFVTNTTSRTGRDLVGILRRADFDVTVQEVVTPARLARSILRRRGHHRGILLADEAALPDLGWFEPTDPEAAAAVLLATEAHDRRIDSFQPAVLALRSGARLYVLQENRVFARDGRLLTDLGPVAAFLGYAADVGWETLGKPSALLYRAVAEELGCALADLVAVGDDAEFDVAGALRAGVGTGVLVRTGKYRAGDAERYEPRPTLVIESVAELPEALS